MSTPLRPSHIVAALPGRKLAALADQLLAGGLSPHEAAVEIATVIDMAIDWTAILPGVVGSILETADGPVLRLVAEIVVGAAVKRGKR
jgi:hypothetical protein